MRNYHLLISFFWALFIYAPECVYPVATLSDGTFYLLYQNASGHLELWRWDAQTQMAELAMLTRFTPAGLQLMPNDLGFSFIDNGMIRIKMNHKRSPKTLSLDQPLYDIKSVTWYSACEALVSASLKNSKGIFRVSLDGHVESALFSKGTDFLYPCMVDNTLFYIERGHSSGQFMLKKENEDEERVIFQDFRPLVFLQMISAEYGLVLSHPSYIKKGDDLIPFKVYEICFDGSEWKTSELFCFSVPTELMFFEKEERLYESMLPLLPRYLDGKIYFYDAYQKNDDVNHNKSNVNHIESVNIPFLRLCVFHKDSGVIPLLESNTHYFGFAFDGKHIFTGGVVTKTRIGVCEDRNRVICVGDGGPPMKVHLPHFASQQIT